MSRTCSLAYFAIQIGGFDCYAKKVKSTHVFRLVICDRILLHLDELNTSFITFNLSWKHSIAVALFTESVPWHYLTCFLLHTYYHYQSNHCKSASYQFYDLLLSTFLLARCTCFFHLLLLLISHFCLSTNNILLHNDCLLWLQGHKNPLPPLPALPTNTFTFHSAQCLLVFCRLRFLITC